MRITSAMLWFLHVKSNQFARMAENFDWTSACMLLSVLCVVMLGFIMKQSKAFVPRAGFLASVGAKRPLQTSLSSPSTEDKLALAMSRSWDIKGVKSELSRMYLRALKKVQKANDRLTKSSEGAQGEKSPQELKTELDELLARASSLKELEDSLIHVKNTKDSKFIELIPQLVELDVSDQPPERLEKVVVKKSKAPKPAPRKPYFVYKSADNIEIFVGRAADDNDKLSCDPNLRDENDWWLHVAGYPGSHVVIRCTDDDLPQKYPETLRDAATLATANSKFEPKTRAQVTVTRVRFVKKPPGAKDGLVMIVGRESNVKTVAINLNSEAQRLERLKKID